MTNRHPTSVQTPLLTIRDVAERLRVSEKTVRRWIEAGELIAHRLGRQIRISDRDLQVFLNDHRSIRWQ